MYWMKGSSETQSVLTVNKINKEMIIIDTGTIEEVARLAGEAVCVTPTVCAWCWTGHTHIPAPVLIGALGTMPATLMSETEKKKLRSTINSAFYDKKTLFGTRPGLRV